MRNNKPKIDEKIFFRLIIISTIIAITLVIPTILVFFLIYNKTDNILLSVIIGFSIHFIIFAFSEKISKFLLKIY